MVQKVSVIQKHLLYLTLIPLKYKIKLDNALKFGQDTEDLEIEHLNNLNNINFIKENFSNVAIFVKERNILVEDEDCYKTIQPDDTSPKIANLKTRLKDRKEKILSSLSERKSTNNL